MSVFALADLHLSLNNPDKKMDAFGEPWVNYTDKIAKNWKDKIKDEDLVLIPGDISWALRPEEARSDLEWIDKLPGQKVLLRGNHDYWWTSLSKIEKILPPSLHLIQNNAFYWNGIAIGGTRLWDSPEYSFDGFINFVENPKAKKLSEEKYDPKEAERIFERELLRLELSLKKMDPKASLRIAMTHYPPIGADLRPSQTSKLLEKYQVNICVFGHLHNVKKDSLPFGKAGNTQFHLVSADLLDFCPLKIV